MSISFICLLVTPIILVNIMFIIGAYGHYKQVDEELKKRNLAQPQDRLDG